MALVYVIEDDAALREILMDALRQAVGVTALGCGTVNEAVQSMAQYPPDLLISELHLQGRSGLEVLWELDQRGLGIPVVFVTGFLANYQEYIPDRPLLAVLEKPFELDHLLHHVQASLSAMPAIGPAATLDPSMAHSQVTEAAPETLQGEATHEQWVEGQTEDPESVQAPFSMFDYLQLSCVGGHTVEINVFSAGDHSDLIGRVIVLGGELWSTQDAQGIGTDAFLRLACLMDTRVTCNALLQTSLPRNIHSPWDAVLLRAATLRDDVRERVQRGFDKDTPTSEDPWSAGPLERPTFTGPPPSHANAPTQGWALESERFEPSAPVQLQVNLSREEVQPETDPEHSYPGLHDLVLAANAYEDQGNIAQALVILEQAMVHYPGHPEILLAALRLQGKQG